MTYPGGKNGDGVFQRIISNIPPHRVYLEPFVGGGAVLRLKRPAELSIACDLDRDVVLALAAARNVEWWGRNLGGGEGRFATVLSLEQLLRSVPARATPDPARGATRHFWREDPHYWFAHGDGIALLERYPFQGDELVYCDPPYPESTRTRRNLYRYEMTDQDHERLLAAIRRIKARVMISSYWSRMYASGLKGWRSFNFGAATRAGKRALETVWSNFPEPVELHDYRYLGEGFRERERIKRKKARWTARLNRMPLLERRALLHAIEEWRKTIDASGEGGSCIARSGEVAGPLAKSGGIGRRNL